MTIQARLVIGDASLGNNNGFLSAYSRAVKSELAALGVECVVIAFDKDRPGQFLKALIKETAAPDTIFLGNVFFYDLGVYSQNHYDCFSLFEALNIPVIARVDDDPYTKFMWPRLNRSPANALHVASHPGMIGFSRLMFPRLKNWEFLPNCIMIPDEDAAPGDREIDLLVPLSKSLGPDVNSVLRLAKEHSDAAYGLCHHIAEGIRARHGQVDLFDLFQEYRSVNGHQFTAIGREGVAGVFTHMSAMDQALRKERRHAYLSCLGEINPEWNIVVVGTPAVGDATGKNITYMAPTHVTELWKLFYKSKAVLNVHPNTARAAHDRVGNSMAGGCASVTDPTLFLEREFVDREDVVFVRSPKELVQCSYSLTKDDLVRIGKRSAGKARRMFSVHKHLQDMSRRTVNLFGRMLVPDASLAEEPT